MSEYIIKKISEKKEFSKLPKSVIKRVLNLKEVKKECVEKEKVKKARAVLRKVFTAFLTRKILKNKFKKGDFKLILKSHYSTKERDYKQIYLRIFQNLKEVKTIIDLGSGVNGFSYVYLKETLGSEINYLAVEAVKQVVEIMNNYFKENKFNAKAIYQDLFEVKEVLKIIKKTQKPRAVLMFNIIDSLELVERNFSKKFILEVFEILDRKDRIVLSFPFKSLSKKKQFKANRSWLVKFVEENFQILDNFDSGSERFFVLTKLRFKNKKQFI